MNVTICSRKATEELLRTDTLSRTAVISFCDPPSVGKPAPTPPLDYAGKAARVFTVVVHNLDLTALPDVGLNYDTYMPEADALAAFICQARADGLDILCQCEYGQSRSAACAAAILEYFDGTGISVFADYRYYGRAFRYRKYVSGRRAPLKIGSAALHFPVLYNPGWSRFDRCFDEQMQQTYHNHSSSYDSCE